MERRGIAAIVAVLAIAGCGGSGSPALSRAEFARQANAICKQRTATLASTRKRYARDFRGFATAALPTASKSLDKLKAIKPPASLQRTYDDFLAGESRQLGQARESVAAMKANRAPRQRETVAERHREGAITQSLGLTACM